MRFLHYLTSFWTLTTRNVQVSPAHAKIECRSNAFYLTDLNSKFGTWIVRYGNIEALPNLVA